MSTVQQSIHVKQLDQMMIDVVTTIYGNRLTDKQLAGYINYEFKTSFTEADVRAFYEPGLEDDITDLTLLHEHTTGLKP